MQGTSVGVDEVRKRVAFLIDIYVAVQDGMYQDDPSHHSLVPIVSRDLRPLAIGESGAGLIAGAPVYLIYVANVNR